MLTYLASVVLHWIVVVDCHTVLQTLHVRNLFYSRFGWPTIFL